jgi:putative aminopeptidase FrvX
MRSTSKKSRRSRQSAGCQRHRSRQTSLTLPNTHQVSTVSHIPSSSKLRNQITERSIKQRKSSKTSEPVNKKSLAKYSLLRDLCRIPSPSNHEDAIVAYLSSVPNKHFDVKKTKKNSCYFVYDKCKKAGAKTVLFDAHIDQVHLRIVNLTDIYDKGYVIAIAVGFESDTLSGNSVVHLPTGMKGTVVTIPPHLRMEQYMKTTDTEVSYICIDFGVNGDEVYDMFRQGDIVIFDIDYYMMQNKYIVSTGLDNKVGVYTLLKIMEYFNDHISELACNVVFHFSSREEVDIGSYAPMKNMDFDEIVVYDADIATDNEYISENLVGTVILGNGIVLTHNYEDDKKLSDKLVSICKKNRIPYQETFSSSFGGSNALGYARMFDAYTQFIGIPLRNMHSPAEVVCMHDLDIAVRLGVEYLKSG